MPIHHKTGEAQPETRKHGPRVALVTPYDGGNLGDAAIQDSMISNLRLRMPDVQFLGITLNGDNFVTQHGATVTFPLLASGLSSRNGSPEEFPAATWSSGPSGCSVRTTSPENTESCPLGAREHSGTGAVFEKSADERDRGRPRDRPFLRRLPDPAYAGCPADFRWWPTR